ncbi:nucleotidyltransferase family protein [Paenibacillus sp. M1]|uniref:Nucleotidyltransferase family protein n=1 Tax=Paenibacillus haidiansis TaxID=1574488 RepID=A0ABU7VPL6_9BACL
MEETDRLIHILQKNELLMHVFDRMEHVEIGAYYIGAGCIAQTVWNELTHRPFMYGIDDIDIVYFNKNDLSYEAEDEVIRYIKEMFSNLPVKLDIKNQARVHLWYPDKFAIDIKAFETLEQAIDNWPSTATAFGVRKERTGSWKIYAPFGFDDLFHLTVRANKKLITKEIYMNKALKWQAKWPELILLEWERGIDYVPR